MAALAASCSILPTPSAVANRARFFNSWLRRIAPATHQDQAISAELLSPWRLGRPRRTLVPLHVQWVDHIRVAVIALTPIRFWLTLRAIRFLQLGGGDSVSNSFALAEVTPGRFIVLPVTAVNHAKQRVTSNGFRSFNMWKHARAAQSGGCD